MIEMSSIYKSFGQQTVIENFNLQVGRGEIQVLLGASGSGKTTLLRMIGGLTAPDQGSVTLQGKNVFDFDARERTTRLSYITQEGGLFPHLTARENILLPAKVRKIDSSLVKKRLEKLSLMVDLEFSFLEKFP